MPVVHTDGQAAAGLNDAAISHASQDQLDHKAYATALTKLLDDPSLETPVAIGLNGPWGSGKTSIGNLVVNSLANPAETRGHRIFEYDAWSNEVGENGAIPLLRLVAQDLNERREWPTRLFRPISWNLLNRRDRFRRIVAWIVGVLVGMSFLASLALTWIPGLAAVKALAVLEGIPTPIRALVLVILVLSVLGASADAVTRTFGRFVRNPAGGEHEDLSLMRHEFRRLVEASHDGSGRYVVCIDNLDRCNVHNVRQILETVNKVLAIPQVVVLIMADFEDLAERLMVGGRSHPEIKRHQATEYLEKIVAVPFDIPVTAPSDLLERVGRETPEAEESAKRVGLRQALQVLFVDPLRELQNPIRANWSRREAGARPLAEEVSGNGWASGVAIPLYLLTLSALVFVRSIAAIAIERNYPFRERHTAAALSDVFPRMRPSYWFWVVVHLAIIPVAIVLALVLHGVNAIFSIYIAVFLFLMTAGFAAKSVGAQARALQKEDQERLTTARQRGESETGSGNYEVPKELQSARVPLEAVASAYLVGRFRSEVRDIETSLQEEEFVNFLRPTPRHIKRFKNRARLALLLAQNNNLISESGEVTRQLLLKWVALEERWPEVARRIRLNPQCHDDYAKQSDPVGAFLTCAPDLGPALPRIVTLGNSTWSGHARTTMG